MYTIQDFTGTALVCYDTLSEAIAYSEAMALLDKQCDRLMVGYYQIINNETQTVIYTI